MAIYSESESDSIGCIGGDLYMNSILSPMLVEVNMSQLRVMAR